MLEARRRGRPPLYIARKDEIREIHLLLRIELWTAVADYCKSSGENNISLGIRTLLRERLSQLGYAKEKLEILPPPKRSLRDP
ncbi:hypothetical protein E6H16_04165 [Candidatus Bathyarchaeota archaeon]|nr:MAG: hypothetical protein E6H16_04165 [Candidatus Bathyarchaeota archaeon]